jgi:hypothetical protein
MKVIGTIIINKKAIAQHTLQRIWAFGLMESWFCIWEYLANPKIGLNLVPNPL